MTAAGPRTPVNALRPARTSGPEEQLADSRGRRQGLVPIPIERIPGIGVVEADSAIRDW
jgi:hypothetical protein